jgi:hypothetical protein
LWTVASFTAGWSDGATLFVPEDAGAASDIEALVEQELVSVR